MKIGVSLPPAFLAGKAMTEHQRKMMESSGGADGFLRRLKKAGVSSVELRAIRPGTAPEEVREAVRAATEAGLSLTVHGALKDEPAELFWGRMEPVLDVQPALTVTVHSAGDRETTLMLLRRMAEYAAFRFPEAKLALENNRSKKGDNMDLVECFGVMKTLSILECPNVGACWDFGHYYWDRLTHPAQLPDELPPEGFLRRAVHTHIHAVENDTTHFPLTTGQLPLEEFVRALSGAGYTGVYNLEPEPERWDEERDAAEEIIRSAELLVEMLRKIGGDGQ